uniref:Protein yippee-like n=1 Tax=Panagrellus redivivus TaxID=6233 RepID=A0A7E5A0X6_PANRE
MGRLFIEDFGGDETFECRNCKIFLSNRHELVSETFRGATGTAFLFNKVANIRTGDMHERNMMTGKHFIRDVFCKKCETKLGWMYEFAVDEEQRYKEGKTILERKYITETILNKKAGSKEDNASEYADLSSPSPSPPPAEDDDDDDDVDADDDANLV